MRSAAVLTLFAILSGCAAANGAGPPATPGLAAFGKPGEAERRRQVMLDVAAMAEGMEGASLSRARRAGL